MAPSILTVTDSARRGIFTLLWAFAGEVVSKSVSLVAKRFIFISASVGARIEKAKVTAPF
jgi:hypothetical protein